ncbi:MAG: 50S ribosomal protein L3 [Limisphaerales bacterium]
MIGLLGKKLGQTRIYDSAGAAVAVTVVLAGPNRVLQCKTKETDGYNSVQLGFGAQKIQRLSKPVLGHLVRWGAVEKAMVGRANVKDAAKPIIGAVAKIMEFRDFSKQVKSGDLIGVDIFVAGDFIDAIGVTKGRGFEGVVKRHGFAGGDSTHGAKGWHRRSGAIGQRLFPGTVMRGTRMPGHMGRVSRTTQNLEVVRVLTEENLLLIKGSIPGANGDYVVIREAKKVPKTLAEVRRLAKAETIAKAAESRKAAKVGRR